MKKVTSFMVSALLIGAITLSSCGKKGEKPVQPQSNTLEMDFSQFPEEGSGKHAGKTDSTLNNWSHSVVTIGVWQIIVAVNVVVPVWAYVESFNHEAKWVNKEDKWLWKYSVTNNTGTYDCKLYGWVDGGNSNWEFYVSKQGDYSDFLWFSGISDLGEEEGTWTLHKEPNGSQAAYLDITWHKNDDGTSDITYTNIEANSPDKGGYITYGLTNDTERDAYYTVYLKNTDDKTEIEWNTTTHEGRVRHEKHFNDIDWHCWDTEVKDAICN